MIRSNRAAPLRVLALVVAAAVAPAIAGCQAGFNAPTQKWHQPAAGASKIVNDVLRINNVFVLGDTYHPATLTGVLVGVDGSVAGVARDRGRGFDLTARMRSLVPQPGGTGTASVAAGPTGG